MITQHHIDALQVILNNDVTMKALRTVFDQTIQDNLPTVGTEPDDVIGQRYRATTAAQTIINDAFALMQTYRKDSAPNTSEHRHI